MISRRRVLSGLAAAAAPGPALAADSRERAYGADPKQRLDLYPLPGAKAAPVLVFVHGGGWINGDKRRLHSLPDYARRHGFLLASINYRLVPQVRDAGGCALDVAAALGWLRANVARAGGDPRRMVLMGHSAGAHLAALVATDPAYLATQKMAPADLSGILLLDGLGYDAVPLIALDRRKPGAAPGWFRQALGARPEALSPVRQARRGKPLPPFLIYFPGRRANARGESLALRNAVRAAGGKARAVRAWGDTHGWLARELGVAGDPEGERAVAFIRTGKL